MLYVPRVQNAIRVTQNKNVIASGSFYLIAQMFLLPQTSFCSLVKHHVLRTWICILMEAEVDCNN